MSERNLDAMIRSAMEGATMPDNVRARMDEALASVQAGAVGQAGDVAGETPAAAGGPRVRQRAFRGWRRVAAIAIAAALCTGGTAYAVNAYYQMSVEKTAEHAVEMSIDGEAVPADEVPAVELQLNYLPEGMEPSDKGGWSYTDDTGIDGGIFASEMTYTEADPLEVDFVRGFEQVKVGERDAILVDVNASTDPTWGNRDLFVAYPEDSRIVLVSSWGHVDEAELMRVAEGAQLVRTGGTVKVADQFTWGEYVENMREQKASATEAYLDEPRRTEATAAEMANLHKVGETFALPASDFDDLGTEVPFDVRVADVRVADDLSGLDESLIPEQWLALVGDDGTLGTDEIEYVKFGDGKDALNEVVKTEESKLKLVDVTVEYTNTTDEDMDEMYFMGTLMVIAPTDGGGYRIVDRAVGTDADEAYHATPTVGEGEMFYYDAPGDSAKNYADVPAGQTATVHLAWLVDEEDLGNLFLNLDSRAGWYEFDDSMLETGLVDIRQ